MKLFYLTCAKQDTPVATVCAACSGQVSYFYNVHAARLHRVHGVIQVYLLQLSDPLPYFIASRASPES